MITIFIFRIVLFARFPKETRDKSRLLLVDRADNSYKESIFHNLLDYLNPGDCLVLNDTRVYSARLYGISNRTKKKHEFLLLEDFANSGWKALINKYKYCKENDLFSFSLGIEGKIIKKSSNGIVYVCFNRKITYELLDSIGEVPLPPYIMKLRGFVDKDRETYQTVYAKVSGSVASPTAGLHFTPSLLGDIKKKGLIIANITLHVSLGTFRPINTDKVESHSLDEERYIIKESEANKINRAIESGNRVIAVGTTVTRTIEHSFKDGKVIAGEGKTNLYIYPGYNFRVVNAIISNLHIPKSTPLLLISAFAGKALINKAYDYAIKREFRFFSYGDSMLII